MNQPSRDNLLDFLFFKEHVGLYTLAPTHLVSCGRYEMSLHKVLHYRNLHFVMSKSPFFTNLPPGL